MSGYLQRHQLQKQTAESVPRNDEEQTKVETLKKQFTPKQFQTKFPWKPMDIIFSIPENKMPKSWRCCTILKLIETFDQ